MDFERANDVELQLASAARMGFGSGGVVTVTVDQERVLTLTRAMVEAAQAAALGLEIEVSAKEFMAAVISVGVNLFDGYLEGREAPEEYRQMLWSAYVMSTAHSVGHVAGVPVTFGEGP